MRKFKKVYIEITNICNLNCNFCPKTGRKLEFMEEEAFEHVLKSVKPYTDHIYFHLMGEPLLNPKLGRFLEISNEYGLKVNITTNGTLIKNAREVLLSSPALRQVNMSLHSFEANEDDVDFDEYIDNIIEFVKEARDNTNIITSMRLWNLDTRHKASNSLNKNIFKILEEKFELNYDLKETFTEKNSTKLFKDVYLSMAEKFEWPNINIAPSNERMFCYGLRDQFGILVDGTVVPCCLDSEGNMNLGNIFETELEEILESKRASDIYDGFSRRTAVEDLCKTCGYVNKKR
ncbi:SPASM domain-containing protein [Clostridium gasigenes]|uniref:radical SAM/SPASM domain-containing protein n=1 Tax=Clostridium gasigenes TaxID=94869 RepID=UPI0014383407|nr:radical SAM protein [Clostridium gasigenes]NKF08430.1 radical SAM protein [Clostridium gasigenes]QSW18606.1 SPASM domain-containing protein [Clostridium gasigenes]